MGGYRLDLLMHFFLVDYPGSTYVKPYYYETPLWKSFEDYNICIKSSFNETVLVAIFNSTQRFRKSYESLTGQNIDRTVPVNQTASYSLVISSVDIPKATEGTLKIEATHPETRHVEWVSYVGFILIILVIPLVTTSIRKKSKILGSSPLKGLK